MDTTDSLKKLYLAKLEKRDPLLLAEMWAWLHMLGKLHEDFINGNYNMDTEVPKDIEHNFPDIEREVSNTEPKDVEHLHGLHTLLTNVDAWNDHTGKNRILGKLPLNSVLQA